MSVRAPEDAPAGPAGHGARDSLVAALVSGDDRRAAVVLKGVVVGPVENAADVRDRVQVETLAAVLCARTGDPENGIRHAAAALSVAQVADDDGADLEALARLGTAAVLAAVREWSESLAELAVAGPRLDRLAPLWAPWCGQLLTAQCLLETDRPGDAVTVVARGADLPAGSDADLRLGLLRLVEVDARTRQWAAARTVGDDRAARGARDAALRACERAEQAVLPGAPWWPAELWMRRVALLDPSTHGRTPEGDEVVARLEAAGALLLAEDPAAPPTAGSTGFDRDLAPSVVRAARVQLALARVWWAWGELDRAREAARRGLEVLARAGDDRGPADRLQLEVQLLAVSADLALAAGDPHAAHRALCRRLVRAREARATVSRSRSAVLARRIGTERALAQAARIRARELRESITHDRLAMRVAALSEDAEHDPLTGLANRRLLTSFLTTALADASALGQSLVVAVLDVDHFKQVNDRHSHAVGDEVLRRLAELLRRQTRAEDLAARLGGEEFVVVLSGVTRASASTALERIRVAVQEHPWAEVADGLAVTVSIGACDFTAFETPDAGLRRADELLYEAKRAGRNRLRLDIHRAPTRPLPGAAPAEEGQPRLGPPGREPAPVTGTEPGADQDREVQSSGAPAPGEVEVLVAEALRMDQGREYAGSHAVARRALDLAERTAVPGPVLVDALVVASLSEALVGDPETALGLATRASAAAQVAEGDPAAQLWPRLALLRAQLQLDDVTGALSTLDEVWPDAEQARDWYPRYLCQRAFGYLAMVTDRPQDAVVWHERALQTTRPLAPPARVAMAALEAVSPWVRLGDLLRDMGEREDAAAAWQHGLEALERAVELVAAADTLQQRFSLAAARGALLARTGRQQQAWSSFDAALASAAGAWGGHQLIEVRLERARLCLAEGRLDAAELERREAEVLDRAAPEPVARLGILALGADLAQRSGRIAEAARLLREHAAVEEQIALGEGQARTRVIELRRRTEEALREAAAAAAHTATLSEENSQLRERIEVLAHEALHDPLTELPDRRQLDARFAQVHAEARDSGEPLCLAMLDVDRFKAVNDSFGHDIGDQVLRRLARVVQEQIRSDELVARYGGEEFVILFHRVGRAAAAQRCDRIRLAVAGHDWSSVAPGLRVTVSIGVDEISDRPTSEAALRHVDALLYTAKRNGRDQVVSGHPA